ncbi:hypothetical protein ACIREO_23250 [Streptomyces sp. NPDC102441]|uniref:hypothetical protein n=1 Tax=Streptomyces sp. NPDC102441 TaxID=3366176 RepID=UPI0038289C62
MRARYGGCEPYPPDRRPEQEGGRPLSWEGLLIATGTVVLAVIFAVAAHIWLHPLLL